MAWLKRAQFLASLNNAHTRSNYFKFFKKQFNFEVYKYNFTNR